MNVKVVTAFGMAHPQKIHLRNLLDLAHKSPSPPGTWCRVLDAGSPCSLIRLLVRVHNTVSHGHWDSHSLYKTRHKSTPSQFARVNSLNYGLHHEISSGISAGDHTTTETKSLFIKGYDASSLLSTLMRDQDISSSVPKYLRNLCTIIFCGKS